MNCPNCNSTNIRPSGDDLYACFGCGRTIGNFYPAPESLQDIAARQSADIVARLTAAKVRAREIQLAGAKAQVVYVGPPHARIKVTADTTVPPHMAYALEVVPVGLLIERDRLRREAGEVMGVKFLAPQPPPNPLDAVIDGVTLRRLLMYSEMYRREEVPASPRHVFTPAQRAAVSAHWSAELRARVEATAKPKLTMMVEVDDE